MAVEWTALELFNMIISRNTAHALIAAVTAFDFEAAAAAASSFASWSALCDSACVVSIEQDRRAAAAAVAQAQSQVAQQPADFNGVGGQAGPADAGVLVATCLSSFHCIARERDSRELDTLF